MKSTQVQINRNEMLAVLRATQFITDKNRTVIELDKKEQGHLLNFAKRLINVTGFIGIVYDDRY